MNQTSIERLVEELKSFVPKIGSDTELTDWWEFDRKATEKLTSALSQARQEGREDLVDALHALGMMYSQYCSEHGHEFMSAGEAACEVLERYGLLASDDAGRGEVKYERDAIISALTTEGK